MNPDELRNFWLKLRGDRQQELLTGLNDSNALARAKEAALLAALHHIVTEYLDTFKPQG